ncbi:MAG: S1 RNA-binding domain-containing protein, partial [Leptospiraceae bacterium]|nr:S1 RNA-binding domain-containing protein [Leptospiraceae bacterium]
FYFTHTLTEENFTEENLQIAKEKEIPVLGQVSSETENGYDIKLGEYTGFCPHSQMDAEKKGKSLVGQKFRFIVSEFHSKGKKLVLSHKKLSDKQKELKKEILKTELKEGQYVTCQIKSIHNFGLIVDVNGFDALVPISEASFKRNPDLNKEYTIGQTLRGKILQLNWAENKITISLKESLNDPWSQKLPLKEGDIVSGVIDSIKPFGLFIKLNEHFHALVPTKETGVPSRVPLHNNFNVGDKVEIFITEINPEKRQIAASIFKAKETKEKLEYQAYLQSQQVSEGTSLGQILKNKLGKK